MGTVVDNDIIRITCKMSYNSGVDDIRNVYHTRSQGTLSQDDETVHDGLADALDDAYTEVNSMFATAIRYDTIETWNVTQDRPMFEKAWPTLTTGANGTTSAPAQVAPLVLFNTNTARSQGRKYLPFPCQDQLTGIGLLDAGSLADMANFLAAILTGWAGGLQSGEFGNWNKVYNRFAPWVSGLIAGVLRTQRRRVRGVGS